MSKRPQYEAGDWTKELSTDATPTRETYTAKKKVAKTKREGETAVLFYMPVATHKRLKALAVEHNTFIQQILAEALDEWLAKNAEPPFDPSPHKKE